MNSIWEPTYIVTDVETTGSNPVKNRITELACVTVRGGEIVSEFSTLINPHQEIPPYVAKMTGISQSMVSVAPDEYEVVDLVKSIFKVKNPIFVAHNVNFDYSFINAFFQRGFIHFDYPRLCTLKLARKLLPRDLKKNVGDLSEYLGIRMKNRHRALIDAKSTAMILTELLHVAEKEHKINTLDELLLFQNKPIYNYKVNDDIARKLSGQLIDIPYSPGIFRFFDEKDKLIYWDYSFNLNQKLKSFFDTHHITSKSILEMTPNIVRIEWEETDSELSVLILRERMFKKTNPKTPDEKTLNMFDDTKAIPNSNINNSDFIYLQARDNYEKLVDIYLIKNGKLVHQSTIGRKAGLESIKLKIKDIYFDMTNSRNTDFAELQVINKWVEMQNGLGIELPINGLDLESVIHEIQRSIPKAFEIIEPVTHSSLHF